MSGGNEQSGSSGPRAPRSFCIVPTQLLWSANSMDREGARRGKRKAGQGNLLNSFVPLAACPVPICDLREPFGTMTAISGRFPPLFTLWKICCFTQPCPKLGARALPRPAVLVPRHSVRVSAHFQHVCCVCCWAGRRVGQKEENLQVLQWEVEEDG